MTNASFDYPVAKPPFKVVAFEDMTDAQAREHFDWFVSLIPERLALLRKLYNSEMGQQGLDYTFESLIPFWVWMRRHVRLSGKKRFIELKRPREAEGPPVLLDDEGFSLETLALIEDAGRYVAEVFMRQYPFIHWTLSKVKDKHNVNYKLPVLEGLKSQFEPNGKLEPIEFNPEEQALVCVSKFLDGDKADDLLLKAYKRWCEKATKSQP